MNRKVPNSQVRLRSQISGWYPSGPNSVKRIGHLPPEGNSQIFNVQAVQDEWGLTLRFSSHTGKACYWSDQTLDELYFGISQTYKGLGYAEEWATTPDKTCTLRGLNNVKLMMYICPVNGGCEIVSVQIRWRRRKPGRGKK